MKLSSALCSKSSNEQILKFEEKTRCKELIDAPTGTHRKYFWQKEQFDEMYGAKKAQTNSYVRHIGKQSNPEGRKVQ